MRYISPMTEKEMEKMFGVKIEHLTKEEIMKKYGNECYQDIEEKKWVIIEAYKGGYWVSTTDGCFSIESISDIAPQEMTLNFVTRVFRDANYNVTIKNEE